MTIDEIWIDHYTPESNRQSAEWTAKGENRPMWPKTGKVLVPYFLGCLRYFTYRLSWEGKNHQLRILYGVIGAFKERNCKKMTPNEQEKSALSPKQCTASQVDRNDVKITWIALWIAFPSTVFSGSVSQWLLPVYKPKKNTPGNETWLQLRSGSWNWSAFWGQR